MQGSGFCIIKVIFNAFVASVLASLRNYRNSGHIWRIAQL